MKAGLILAVSEPCVYVVDDNDPMILGNSAWGLERETAVLFEVQTCNRVRVQLKNGLMQPVYQLEFAKSEAGVNNISVVATGQTTSGNAQFSQGCENTRQFWVTWKDGVIYAGTGLDPGWKEVMRLADRREDSFKTISVAKMTTVPFDDNANFKIFRSKFS